MRKDNMKNTMLKTIGMMALAVLMITFYAQTSVSAQDIAEEYVTDEKIQEEDALTWRNNARQLEGLWNHTGTRRNCATGEAIVTFSAMFTFARGGTLQEFGTQGPPAMRGPGHGVWSYQSRRQYTTGFQFFRFNADGTYAGKQIVRQQIQLSRDGNSYTASATAQVFDVNGNVIANNCATGTATRFE